MVAAVHESGHVLAAAFRSVETVLTDDGGEEQDAERWWDGTVDAIHEVVGRLATDRADLGACAGIGITGQWGSTVPVAADGSAVGPCLLYTDHRGGPWSKGIAGGGLTVSGYRPTKIVTWLRLSGGGAS